MTVQAESGSRNSEYKDGPDTDNELEIEVVTDIIDNFNILTSDADVV